MEDMKAMTDVADINICTEESCDFLPCLIARRDDAADALRAAMPWEQPAAFLKWSDLARAVRRAEAEEQRYLADMERYFSEVGAV
jgi:hypothetical protein